MRFSELHPCVVILYFVIGLCFISFTQNPILLSIAFVCSLFFALLNSSFAKTVKFVAAFLPMFLTISLILPLFNHRGATELLALPSGNMFTLESLIYSICGAFTLVCAILWFRVNRQLLSSENIYVVLGKISPHLALFFTMSLRFVPRIANNFKLTYSLKRRNCRTFLAKIRSVGSCMVACVSISIEDSLNVVKSMKSRGYGTAKRTFYSPKKFQAVDYFCLLIIAMISILVIFAFLFNSFKCSFYPHFNIENNAGAVVGYIVYFSYFFVPIFFDFCEEFIWKLYR